MRIAIVLVMMLVPNVGLKGQSFEVEPAQPRREVIRVTMQEGDKTLAILQATSASNVQPPRYSDTVISSTPIKWSQGGSITVRQGESCGPDCTWAWDAHKDDLSKEYTLAAMPRYSDTPPTQPQLPHIFAPQPAELPITVDSIDIACNSVSALTPLILGKQVSKIASMYLCFVTNNSAESVVLGEGALLRRVPQLLPYDNATFSLALTRVVTTSVAERIIRILADPTQLFLLFGAAKIIAMPIQVLTGLAAYNAEVPYIQQRIHGAELPIMQNYQSLVINGSLHVAAGDTVTTHVFGVPQGAVGPGFARASIPVKNAPMVRSIQ